MNGADASATAHLRVGVIGVGDFGQRHLDAYRRQPAVDVVAIADSDPQRAASVASRWGVERWFADGAELIAGCSPNGVSIATPGRHHLAPTLAALEHGCSVLLEKPIAMSSSDTAAITKSAAASDAFVVPAHILRFAAPYAAMRARVRDGGLGQLLAISTRRDRGHDHVIRFPDVHPVLMTMIHDIDLALWVSGSRAVRVIAHGSGGNGEHPLLVWAQVEAAGGTVWSLRTSWTLAEDETPVDRFEVYGTAGTSAVDIRQTGAASATPDGGADERGEAEPLALALDAEISHFCSCLRRGVMSDVVSLIEAHHGIRIAEAIISSAAAGGVIAEVLM